MLTSLTHRLHRRATGRNVIILLVVFIAFNAAILPPVIAGFEAMSHGAGLVDLLSSYTPDELYAHLGRFEPQGRQLYILHELTLDVIYPLTNTLLFSLFSAMLLKRALPAASPVQYIALIPLAVLLADFLENVCLVIVLASYPARLEPVARAANLFTLGKWALAYGELLAVIASLAVFLAVKVRGLARRKIASKGGEI